MERPEVSRCSIIYNEYQGCHQRRASVFGTAMIVVRHIERFIQRTLVRPVFSLLTQGLAPEKLALSLVSGATLSTFPVVGSTTILCTAASALFDLNLPAIQLVNYFAFPLQILLLPVFIRIGELLFNASHMPLSAFQILTMIHTDTVGAIRTLWWATLHAIVAWLIVGPPTAFLLYRMLKPGIIYFVHARIQNQK